MALGLLSCSGEPCEFSQTLLDIITFNTKTPHTQHISSDNEELKNVMELIFQCGITGIANNMKVFL